MARIFWKHDPEVAQGIIEEAAENGVTIEPALAQFYAALLEAGINVDIYTGEWENPRGVGTIAVNGFTGPETRREAHPTDTASAE